MCAPTHPHAQPPAPYSFSLSQEPDLIDSDIEDDAGNEEDSEGEACIQGMEELMPDRSSQLPGMMQASAKAKDTAMTSSGSAAGKSHVPGTAKTAGLRAGFFTCETTSSLSL